jgi:hypothetical protein
MKTSNKLLLAIFLTIILLTTAVQLMVYAKYKRGEYVPFQRDNSPITTFTIPPVRVVSITGLGGCEIISGDTAKLEIQDYKNSRVAYKMANDTLIIYDNGEYNSDQIKDGARNWHLVKVYLPDNVQINAQYANLKIGGNGDSAQAPSYTLHLGKNSYLGILNHDRENVNLYYNQLHIISESSNISFDDHIIIKGLNIKLVDSRFEDQEALIGNMTMDADSDSHVSLSGKNVKALK